MMMQGGMALAVHPDAPSRYSPLHLDDIVGSLPLLAAASVPATVVNWGGDEVVSVEEWCTFLGELVGIEAVFEVDPNAIPPLPLDVSRLHELGFHSTVSWRDGLRRLVDASKRGPRPLRPLSTRAVSVISAMRDTWSPISPVACTRPQSSSSASRSPAACSSVSTSRSTIT